MPGPERVFHHQGVRGRRSVYPVPHGDPGGHLVHHGVRGSAVVVGLPIALPGLPGAAEVREATILYYR